MDRKDLLSLYRQMLLILRFEGKSAEMYALAKANIEHRMD